MRHLSICVLLLLVFLGGCNLLKPSCDSPIVLSTLREILAGISGEVQPEQAAWLKKTVSVTVMKEDRDDSGRHLTCEAHINVPKEVLVDGNPFLQAFEAMASATVRSLTEITVRYVVSTDTDSNVTVVLSPANDDEEAVLKLIRMSLERKMAPNAEKERQSNAVSEIVDAQKQFRGAQTNQQVPSTSDTANFKGGRYQRTSPLSDMTITSNGDNNWHVTIVGAGPALGENTPADCQIDADGPLEQGQIVGTFESSSGDGKVVVRLTETGATVPDADVSGCGNHSDLTGDYRRLN